jgi:16S rRNA (uracil1498-N3)-methyltransferase
MSRRPERTARFRVETGALARPSIELRGDALHHLRSVLRLRAGDQVELFDGAGMGAAAEIVRVTAEAAELRILAPTSAERESPLDLTLSVALARGGKLDWIVEKATELGVRRILPFAAERSTPRADKSERWRRIASAAAAQSGRVVAPEILPVARLEAVLADREAYDRRLFLWEKATAPLRTEVGRAPRRVLVVTGPEGGFSAAESQRALAAGLELVGLGPRILRAETAAIAAVALCQILWGDLAAPGA